MAVSPPICNRGRPVAGLCFASGGHEFAVFRSAVGGGSPGAIRAYGEILATLDLWLHLPRPLARAGGAIRASAQAADLRTDRGDRRSPHDQSSRSDRRDAQLGLSLYLAARRGLYRLCISAPRLHRGSRGFCQLDSELCGPAPARGEEVAGGLHHPRRQSAARGNFASLGGISAIEARVHWQRQWSNIKTTSTAKFDSLYLYNST